MNNIFDNDIKELMKLATTDFDKFYEETAKGNKSSGYYRTAASSGHSSTAASSGDYSKAASSGDSSTAASSGYNSACSALGYRAAVKGDMGNLIMASEYQNKGGTFIPIGGKADIVDGKILKPNQWYIVENGEWVAVDYTDGIFSRIISIKGDVKKVKTDNDDVFFIISDGEYSAHGKTIKQAREDLAFKIMSRDVSQFENMPTNTKKTPNEWALIYRAITGACQSGTQYFIERQGKTKAKYTLKEILTITKDQYGSERFKEVVS